MSYRDSANLYRNRDDYRAWIQQALGKALGYGPDCVRKIMALTGATEGSARNWAEGTHSMSAISLLALMAADDSFCAEVLRAAGRDELADAIDAKTALADVRASLAKAQAILARHE